MSILRALGLLLTLNSLEPAPAENLPVTLDRAPLTFRDSGLYANLNCVHGVDPTQEGVTNLLTAERARDPRTPWDFFVMQYNAEGPSPELAGTLREFARNGKKIILRVLLGKKAQKIGLNVAKQRLTELFQHTDPRWLYAITLDEENVYWFGGTETLTALYHWCKERWPELPVYQWWTPMVAPEVGTTSGWVALPADGWVLDLYGQPAAAFEKKLLKFLETGKPAIHVAWASPTWVFYDREGCTKEDWWATAGRKVFDDQVRVCREYNVPVAYFCCQEAEVVDGKQVAPIRWGWHALDPATRRWFRELEALVANFDFLPAEEIGFRQPTPRLFAWAHSAPTVQGTVSLDDKERTRFSWRTSFPEVDKAPGEHEVPDPYGNPYVRLSYIQDENAQYLQDGFAITSIGKRALTVPVVLKVTPLQPATDWQVTADTAPIQELGGSAKLAFSPDGKTWSGESATDAAGGHRQTLTLGAEALGGLDGTTPFWLRVTLIANAGLKTNVAVRLTALEVGASLVPRQ